MSIHNPIVLGLVTALVCAVVAVIGPRFFDPSLFYDPPRAALGGFACGVVAGLARIGLRKLRLDGQR